MSQDIAHYIEQLQEVIELANNQIKQLQKRCQHPEYTAKYDSSDGGYYDTPEYWVILNCPQCGWNELHDHKDEKGNKIPEYYQNHPRVIK